MERGNEGWDGRIAVNAENLKYLSEKLQYELACALMLTRDWKWCRNF